MWMETYVNGDLKEETHIQQGRLYQAFRGGSVDDFLPVPFSSLPFPSLPFTSLPYPSLPFPYRLSSSHLTSSGSCCRNPLNWEKSIHMTCSKSCGVVTAVLPSH